MMSKRRSHGAPILYSRIFRAFVLVEHKLCRENDHGYRARLSRTETSLAQTGGTHLIPSVQLAHIYIFRSWQTRRGRLMRRRWLADRPCISLRVGRYPWTMPAAAFHLLAPLECFHYLTDCAAPTLYLLGGPSPSMILFIPSRCRRSGARGRGSSIRAD